MVSVRRSVRAWTCASACRSVAVVTVRLSVKLEACRNADGDVVGGLNSRGCHSGTSTAAASLTQPSSRLLGSWDALDSMLFQGTTV